LQPRFLAELSFAIDQHVTSENLLDLAQTDLVRARLKEGYSAVLQNHTPSFRKFFRKDQRSYLLYMVDCLAVAIGSEQAILHIKNSDFCGAIRSEASAFLNCSEKLLLLDGDSLSILSADYQQGLILDINPDEIDEHYELTVWGDRWAPVVP